MSIKLAYYSITSQNKAERINVIIYGAGKEGISVMHTLSGAQSSPFRVVGFMDDMTGKIGKSVQGVEIYDPGAVTNEFLHKKNVKDIILAMPHVGEEQKTEIYNRLLGLDVTIKSVPPVEAWINGELNLSKGLVNYILRDPDALTYLCNQNPSHEQAGSQSPFRRDAPSYPVMAAEQDITKAILH